MINMRPKQAYETLRAYFANIAEGRRIIREYKDLASRLYDGIYKDTELSSLLTQLSKIISQMEEFNRRTSTNRFDIDSYRNAQATLEQRVEDRYFSNLAYAH